MLVRGRQTRKHSPVCHPQWHTDCGSLCVIYIYTPIFISTCIIMTHHKRIQNTTTKTHRDQHRSNASTGLCDLFSAVVGAPAREPPTCGDNKLSNLKYTGPVWGWQVVLHSILHTYIQHYTTLYITLHNMMMGIQVHAVRLCARACVWMLHY